jgi:pantoate kinase
MDAMDEPEKDKVTEAALDEALEQEPRAAELRNLAQVLARRLQAFQREHDEATDPAQRVKLQKEIAKMRQQVAVLSEEADINQFVEDAVRVGIEMRRYEN